MIKNLITTAFRNFLRQPLFSGINIIGLAIGIASSLLIMVYILNELSYDSFHPDVDRLYRVNQTNIWDPAGGKSSSTVIPLASALVTEFPEVESALRVNDPQELLVQYEDKAFYESRVLAVDSNFFSFFGFKLLKGNPQTALTGKNKVVITEKTASKFFGGESAVGKLILFGDEKIPVEVTGIVASPPANAHFQFDYLWSLTTNPIIEEFSWSWFMTPLVTYIKLKPGASVEYLEEKLKIIAPKYIPPTFERFNMDYEGFVAERGGWNFYLQPVKDIYLHSAEIGNRIGPVSDYNYIVIFNIVAVFILLLGSINFINLSTARASSRAKEVGVRKVLGSFKRQLIFQYLMESIMLSLIATVLGLAFMEMMRIFLQSLLNMELLINWVVIWPYLLLFPVLLGIVSGIYPAFYLTAFNPSKVLKGNLRSGIKSTGFRNALVVVQFTIAIALLSSTVIIQQQLEFLNKKNLGFDRENILVVNHAEKLGEHIKTFRDEITNQETITSASISMDMPGRGTYEDMFSAYGSDKQLAISQLKIDPSFFQTMKLRMSSGRIFEEGRPADFNTVVLNESAVRALGWGVSEAVGKHLNYTGDEMGKLEVIGVVKDFNFQSLREPITPFIFIHYESAMWGDKRVVAIKYKKDDIQRTISFIEKEWKNISDAPLSYSFLDEEFQGVYQSESRMGSIFSMFSILTLIIAAIGLFGLSAYTVERRGKEISIRKIFGASIHNLFILISKEYAVLIIVSFLIAVPITAFGMSYWLNDYAYHIEQSYFPYAITAILISCIVLISSGFKIVAASVKNPILNLKDD